MNTKPSAQEAEQAIKTLIRYIGEDLHREGLQETPQRVIRAYEEMFGGYVLDPAALLSKTFSEVQGYDEMVLLTNIDFISHCEHHMVPIVGKAHIAYVPNGKVVGLSKLARLIDAYARRLQTQETMTNQIVQALQTHLNPLGVALVIEAEHFCMCARGIRKLGVDTLTCRFTGVFEEEKREKRFWSALRREDYREAQRGNTESKN